MWRYFELTLLSTLAVIQFHVIIYTSYSISCGRLTFSFITKDKKTLRIEQKYKQFIENALM